MKQGIELDKVGRVVGGEMHLADIDLKLEPGSFNILLGRTRAGKTSLLRLMAGLDRPTSGSIRFDGEDVTRRDVRQRNVAMVYQQFVNYPSLTVYENIASPLRLAGKLSAPELDRRVRDTAAALRLDPFLKRLPAELSGGQQQRTAMARALVKDASLLLLDEPLANLDYKLREELRTEMRQIFKDRPAVIVYATTEPSEALLLGGRTAVLHEGRLLQVGSTLDVYQSPATERVGQVFSDPQMSLWDVEVTGAEARLSPTVALPLAGHLKALAPGRYRLGLRAHHVRLSPASDTDVRIPARVEVEEVSGSETLIHATHGGLSLTAQVEGIHRHPYGTELDLFIAPSRVFAFGPEGRLVAAPASSQEASHGPH
ncbi:ABC transporter ATP-binding protein [Hyalangium rubrum]|uniref:ABC transporter ATP-binding protein n=1 Tax=Hyalangium rubrum TaxID=3103134 RepID=A0ABU5H1Z1_9BACT|nr:ABC transporter ATP-binding protein [Hyalangium sp. s54d21]MDY7227336.1 ABC transporter ATP-binding protein [Hyalangium sp. s54d21]